MATRIKDTPVLYGADAKRFREQLEANKGKTLSAEEKSAIKAGYERVVDMMAPDMKRRMGIEHDARIVWVPFISREGSSLPGCSECKFPGIGVTYRFCPGCGARFTKNETNVDL